MAAVVASSFSTPLAVLEPIMNVLLSAQTEIIAFLVALCAHWALFGRPLRKRIPRATTICGSSGSAALASCSKGFRSAKRPPSPVAAARVPATGGGGDAASHNAAAKALAVSMDSMIREGDYAAAAKAFEAAKSAGTADAAAFSLMIKCELQRGKLSAARAVVAEMRRAGLQPGSATFNELLNFAVASGGGEQTLWSLFEEMKAAGVQPNHVTCSILLKVIRPSNPRHLDQVFALVDSIDEALDDVLLGSMVDACVRAERRDLLAATLRRRTQGAGCKLRTCHGYGSIIRGCGYLKDIKGAWAAWRDVRSRDLELSSITIGCMVEALATNGDTEGGHALIRELLAQPETRTFVNAVIYCSVLKGFSHAKQFDRVWAIYDEMTREGMQLTIVTYNTLVDACARCGTMAKIPQLLQAMAEQGISPTVVTYSAIIKGYCQESRIDRALEVFDEMRTSGNLKPDEHTYNTLINGCARQLRCEKGIALLDDMMAAGVPPSNFTLSVLVKLMGRVKQTRRAFDLCEELSKKYGLRLNVHVYNNLINACVQNKQLNSALDVFGRMASERVRPDARTYSLLVNGAVLQGRAEDAAGLLRASAGLSSRDGAHSLAEGLPAALLRPREGIAEDFAREAVAGISRTCQKPSLASAVARDLERAFGFRSLSRN
eukprot:TRINITY_DN36964_c0_g1_i1.p1 TRINITY_DN36964_c0_g1~~TRINITY_DN36964_c0_g1_i1.p1  ORF type:complete len:661 (+),score=174.99 TRINITY_DN36964_c0_g1_i1:89-2071(+)